jgi:hypothetical protein
LSTFVDISKFADPVRILLEYIAEVSTSITYGSAVVTGSAQQASDCDMIIVHDNDLGIIDGAVGMFFCLSRYHPHPLAAAVE